MKDQLPKGFTKELFDFYKEASDEVFTAYIHDNLVTAIYSELHQFIEMLSKRSVPHINFLESAGLEVFLSDESVDEFLKSEANFSNIQVHDNEDGTYRIVFVNKSTTLVIKHPAKRVLVLLAMLFWTSRIVFDVSSYEATFHSRRAICQEMEEFVEPEEEENYLFDSEGFEDEEETVH